MPELVFVAIALFVIGKGGVVESNYLGPGSSGIADSGDSRGADDLAAVAGGQESESDASPPSGSDLGEEQDAGGDSREPGEAPRPVPLANASACAPFPAKECGRERAIALCESRDGADPRAYDLNAANGGRLQISRNAWASFFAREYGWSWRDIVFDDQRNREAAFVIYTRAGKSWAPWSCAR